MERPFPAYTGDEPYIFVSYAHEDSALVYPELSWLRDQGFNIWYDEGISPGHRWSDELANSLTESAFFIFFCTPNSVASRHCLNEINLALDKDKPTIAIHLLATELTPGLQLQLSSHQAILRYELGDQDYRTKLLVSAGNYLSATPVDLVENRQTKQSRWRLPAVSVGIIAILAIGFLWYNKPVQAPRQVADSPIETGVPRVAVMPFENQSDDPSQRFFSDGLSEEIATALSRFPVLSVIPPSIASRYAGDDDNLAAEEVGARYLVRGSVRRSPEEVQVSARLLDPRNRTQLWAQTYRRELVASSLFEVQAEIAYSIAATLADATGVVVSVGLQEIRRRTTDSVAAYDCVLRGYAYVSIHTVETHLEARDCLQQAVKIDPNYADAWGHLAYLYVEEFHHNRNLEPDSLDRALAASRRALELDATNTMGLFALALTHFSRGELEVALNQIERAVELNPNDTTLVGLLAFYLVLSGDTERGLELTERTRELNPTPPNWIYNNFGHAYYLRGEYERAMLELSNWGPSKDSQVEALKAASLGMLGRNEEARQVWDDLLARDPVFARNPEAELRRYVVDPGSYSAIATGLTRAGLQLNPQ
jgi:TolB-like protein/Flp pilus assembly protein TadD